MALKRRDLFKAGAAAGSLALLSPPTAQSKPSGALEPITGDVKPISVEERLRRIGRAQGLMQHLNIDALVLEPGSAMLYFTGISWWRSERLTAVILPKEDDITVITPFFEEPSVRESMTFGDDVRTWNENEDPFTLLAGLFRERKQSNPRIALEGSVRYFVVEGIERSLPGARLTGGEPITRACRMLKSPAELALMHKANEVTLTAYAHVYARLEKGMRPADVNAMMHRAQTELGGSGVWTMALFGEASAYPHGSGQPQEIREGQIVLMDCGCAVEGYQSDISRTFVYGQPSAEQQRIWQLVRKGQDIALKAARPGVAAGTVDDAVRAHYTAQGFGPGYQLPGLSTRTGHGIGMDGHEQINFVQGEATPLVEGMCFSNEPGIYIPGKFGVRLEDCLHMSASGPVWFTVPPDSLAEPIGEMGPAIGTS